jgi:hypothetical protein
MAHRYTASKAVGLYLATLCIYNPALDLKQ